MLVTQSVQNRKTSCQLVVMDHFYGGCPVSSSMFPHEVHLPNGPESGAGDQRGVKHLFEQECNAVTLIQSRFMSFLLHWSIL